MLKNDIIRRVDELFQTGRYSQREIAKMLGISHGTVSLIEKGKRKVTKEQEYVIHEPQGNITRCPECGQKTQLPCVYCQIVNILKKKSFNKIPERIDYEKEDEIRLNDEQYKRYCEVRNWRQKQKNPHFITIPDDWPWKTEE